jgi:hypothetical protein
MSPDPVEHEHVAEGAGNVHLVESAAVVGHLPLEVLVDQLGHAAEVNEELRVFLKEERARVMRLELEVENLTKYVSGLESSLKRVQDLSDDRHAEIERLGWELNRALGELRRVHDGNAWKATMLYNATRQRAARARMAFGRAVRRPR